MIANYFGKNYTCESCSIYTMTDLQSLIELFAKTAFTLFVRELFNIYHDAM